MCCTVRDTWKTLHVRPPPLVVRYAANDRIVYTVQAIAISTEVAHNLGHSESNAILFSAAVRIAQCLGLHRITDAATSSGFPTPEKWHENIEREVGKRIWCILLIQDHFAISYNDSYSACSNSHMEKFEQGLIFQLSIHLTSPPLYLRIVTMMN